MAQALQGLGKLGAVLNVLLNNAGSATFGADGRLDAASAGELRVPYQPIFVIISVV